MSTPPTVVRAWRDYDAGTLRVPGMYLGELELSGTTTEMVDQLWSLGARRVELLGWADLAATADPDAAKRAAHTLCLVRDLTAQAVYTQWRLRLPAGAPEWAALSHLQPPAELDGVRDGAAEVARWRESHYLGKFQWRRGPDFFQLRDRRWGDLRRFTLTDPAYLAAVEVLVPAAPADAVPASVLTAFEAQRLTWRVGDQICWLPYATRRWAQSAMLI